MIDFREISLPFNVSDLLSSSMGLIGILGGFILLGLAIYLFPRIKAVIEFAIESDYYRKKINYREGYNISAREWHAKRGTAKEMLYRFKNPN